MVNNFLRQNREKDLESIKIRSDMSSGNCEAYMTEDNQENVMIRNHSKDNGEGERVRLSRRRISDLSLFDVLDRDYYEIFRSTGESRSRSSFSRLIYVVGVVIFLVGAIEGSVAEQFTKFRSLSDWQLYGLVLLTAFVTALVFIGFGKGVEYIVYRSNKS